MKVYYQLYGVRIAICILLSGFGVYFNSVYMAMVMVAIYSSYEYTFKNRIEEKPVTIDATGILLEDIKTSSNWWFRVNAKCLANLTLIHDIGMF